MPAPLVTFVGVAHPWMCDAMGHVNVRHYLAMFDDASFHLLGYLAGPAESTDAGLGWADVRCEVDYRHETRAGALLTVRSQVAKIGRTSLTYRHVMSGTLDDVVHAEVTLITVRFDLSERRPVELEAPLRGRAAALMPD